MAGRKGAHDVLFEIVKADAASDVRDPHLFGEHANPNHHPAEQHGSGHVRLDIVARKIVAVVLEVFESDNGAVSEIAAWTASVDESDVSWDHGDD